MTPLPARDGLPPMGDIGAGTERLCTRTINGIVGPGEILCDKPATVHIIWEDTPGGVETGFVCAEHSPELQRWRPLATHPLGPCCGMPGSRWFIEENECRYEDGLPTVEPVRAVARELVT